VIVVVGVVVMVGVVMVVVLMGTIHGVYRLTEKKPKTTIKIVTLM